MNMRPLTIMTHLSTAASTPRISKDYGWTSRNGYGSLESVQNTWFSTSHGTSSSLSPLMATGNIFCTTLWNKRHSCTHRSPTGQDPPSRKRHVLTTTVRLSIEPHQIIVEDGSNRFVFQLKGITLKPESCRGLRWGSAMELQFSLQINETKDEEGVLNGQVSPSSNQDLLVSRIKTCQSHCYCVGCGAQILKSNCHFQRVLPLPSENWSDFADIWFCHNHSHKNIHSSDETASSTPSEHAHTDINNLKRTSLTPRNEDCLVSNLYMLADGSHFKHSSIISCADRLICKRCGNFLGFVKDKQNNVQQGHQTPGTFKIYFHAISFRNESMDAKESLLKQTMESFPVNNSHNKHRVEEFIGSLLMDQCRIFTSFRFILASSLQVNDQSTISILLWLLDQNLTVFSSHVTKQAWEESSASPLIISPRRHLKVLYKATFSSLEKSLPGPCNHSSNVFQAWRNDNTVHAISLPYPLCKQLIHFLLSSTNQLAPSQRSLNGFHVGYLKAS